MADRHLGAHDHGARGSLRANAAAVETGRLLEEPARATHRVCEERLRKSSRPDYEGLGTPGGHPYLVGPSEGRSVLDVVRAARKLNWHIGKSVAIMGH